MHPYSSPPAARFASKIVLVVNFDHRTFERSEKLSPLVSGARHAVGHPPDPKRRPMCEQCKNLQKQIDQFSRFLQHRFDPLTEERLKAALAEMEKRKAELH
jgi:hypothetical protein